MTQPAQIRVLQCITRMIVGGAQETVLLTADYLNRGRAGGTRFHVDVACGPDTGPEGSLHEELDERGIARHVIAELANPVRPHRDAIAVRKLYRLIRDGGYAIVHTNSTKAGLLGRIAARWAGVPVVVHTVHGWGFHDHVRRGVGPLVALERWLARRTDRLIAVTPRDIEKGLRHGIGRPEQYVTIRSGIELDRFGHPAVPPAEMRAQLGIPPGAIVVGTVTRLSPQKAPLDFVRAARRIAARAPEARFVMVGDGPLRPDVERAIAESGLAERVVLTGLRRDVPELLAAFDVFVLSSLWEGLPRVLPQAMATGLPVVATAADGNAEAVADGVTGYLVPPGDPETLAERTLALLLDPALRRRMADAGRERAADFGAERMVEQIAVLYRQLLGENPDRPRRPRPLASVSGPRR